MTKSEKILTCKDEIKSFLGNISDYAFDKYVRAGMPARCTGKGGDWIAHTSNIEKWFEAYTRINMRASLDEDAEEKKVRRQR